jgi:RNA polymerase sigma-70 factor, ECF subfamily
VDELTSLAHAARLGDAQALNALIRSSYAEVWRMCAALVDEAAAEDLAQESLLRATRALRGFRGESSARTWILAITRRACMDELRARHRRRDRDERILAATVDPVATDPSGEVILRAALAELEPDQRVAFVLTQVLCCSYEQAAAVCGCPVGTIRSRVSRSRDRLVAALAEPAHHAPAGRHRRRSSSITR